jgi:PKHD-type hydroxylase
MNKKQMKSMKKIRTSETCFLNDPWIFKEIKPWIDQANVDARWNFNIDFPEDMQFTKYGLNEFYDWHCDSFAKPFRNHEKKEFDNKIRKISVSCILSRPDEYEGGDFEFDFRNNRKSKNINKISKIERGSVIVFPSFVYHRVQPVTFGTRYSLVIWNLGPSFI